MNYIEKILQKNGNMEISLQNGKCLCTTEQAYLYKNHIDNAIDNIESKKTTTYDTMFYVYKYLILFLIGSLVGSVWETFWHFLKTGDFESRSGVFYGPFSPLYGFGAMLLAFVLRKVKSKLNMFIYASIVGGVFEYVVSFALEKLIGNVYWDYSTYPTNIDGRTTIIYSMFWGILALILMMWVYPFAHKYAIKTYKKKAGLLVKIVILIMIVLTIFTGMVLMRQGLRRAGFEAIGPFSRFIDRVYTDEYIAKAFPALIVS